MKPLTLAMLVALGLALFGCAAPPAPVVTRAVIVHDHVPAPLLACPAAPLVPAADSQAAVARYVVALWAAWDACHADLGQVAALLRADGASGTGAKAASPPGVKP